MPIKIKNWKLAILALVFISFLTSLGFWQLARAKQKTILLASFAERTEHSPLSVQDIVKLSGPSSNFNPQQDPTSRGLTAGSSKPTSSMDPAVKPRDDGYSRDAGNSNRQMSNQSSRDLNDIRFYRVALNGYFDNEHTILLDNKIYHGKVGYEVYTPFKPDGMNVSILIDRGFLPVGSNRKILPTILPIAGKTNVMGLLNLPPAYVSLGKITESSSITWPLRAEFIHLPELSQFIGASLFPYIVTLDPKNPAAFDIEWQIVSVGPERHLGYAVQWFALALTLLIISVVLNKDKK